MGPQDKKDDHRRPDEGGNGAGSSGEGAGSALEALLRKRQMHVDPQADPADPASPQQERSPGGE